MVSVIFPNFANCNRSRQYQMKKYQLDLPVVSNEFLDARHFRLILRHPLLEGELGQMRPGQFVQVQVGESPSTFLRRPISVNFVDPEHGELWLMVQIKGEGTQRLSNLRPGDMLNLLLPLGNGFTMPKKQERVLLIGGGVGVAPMLYFGKLLRDEGIEPVFLLGARSADGLLELDEFSKYGRVMVTTEDGSVGERGFVTQHSILGESFDRLYVCGPKPMMLAVARYARKAGVECEVSLENMMACGVGVCLCCVEKTVRGNVCVCKEGPVFNINQLTWQI